MAEELAAIERTSGDPNVFRYDPVARVRSEIRLLERVGDNLTFQLRHVALDEVPPYIALSYHWGDPTPRHAVSVNGHQLMITTNLKRALSAMFAAVDRSDCDPLWTRGENIYLWADSICINQRDIEEKNVQVELMSEIYRRCKGTLGFVGNPPPGEDPIQPFLALARTSGALIEEDAEGLENFNGNITDFISHQWFLRSWVTQETVLPKEVICFYGDENMHAAFPLDLLGGFIQGIQTIGRVRPEYQLHTDRQPSHNSSKAMVQVHSWAQLRTNLREDPAGISLLKVLSLVQPAHATDQRDKVYSVLGLLKEQDRQAIHVDYSQGNTVEKVYTDLARYIITTSNCMRMLIHAGKSRHLPNLPSWVPDWSHQDQYPLDYRHYRSAGSTTPSMSLSVDGRKLSLKAITFSKIVAVGPRVTYPAGTIEEDSFPQPLQGMNVLVVLEECVHQYCNFIQNQFRRLPGHGSRGEIISRTLTADRGFGDRRAAPDDQRFYEEFMSQYPRGEPVTENPDALAYFPFTVTALHCNRGRRVCATNSGQVGLVPDAAEVGDLVAIFPGAELPFIIRNRERNEFDLIGHCYVHGGMDGEILELLEGSLRTYPEFVGITTDTLFKYIVLV